MTSSFLTTDLFLAACLSVVTGLVVAIWVRRLETYLRERRFLDLPGDRSSHHVPTPRGGGLAVTGTILMVWSAVYVLQTPPSLWALILGAGLCGWISWRDDRVSLPARIRLAVHTVAVGIGSIWLMGQGLVFQGWVTPWVDLALAALLWIGFINFFNFMDGIDGISAVETFSIAVGLVGMTMIGGAALEGLPLSMPATLAAAALGFAIWNWSPARIFLGDVGSVPLGFLLGGLLLGAAAHGSWIEALILPLYYLIDAGLTLSKRILRGEKFWHPHREHFYQRAVQRGLSHAQVSTAILITNSGLVALALCVPIFGWICLLPALGLVGLLILWMMRWPIRS